MREQKIYELQLTDAKLVGTLQTEAYFEDMFIIFWMSSRATLDNIIRWNNKNQSHVYVDTQSYHHTTI